MVVALKGVQVGTLLLSRKPNSKIASDDILSILYLVFGAWHFFSINVPILSPMLFPEPNSVFGMLWEDLGELALTHMPFSLSLFLSGYLLALAVAIPLGIFIATHKRLFLLADPYIKVLGPIPPLVFIPYAIYLMPSFWAASVLVIFLAGFWPILGNTIHGVLNINRSIIDSARVLNLRGSRYMFRIVLPASMPSIVNGANLALLFSFVMLVAAELIGSSTGVGWYIRHFGGFSDYKRVLAGLVFFSLLITAIFWFFTKLQQKLLAWVDTAEMETQKEPL